MYKMLSLRKDPRSDIDPNTTALNAPVTFERPYRQNTHDTIDKPYVARASEAPSFEHPRGSPDYAREHRKYTVLQQHVLFWDRDNDGVIWPSDTFIGFRELGFNVIFSILSTIIINVFLSLPTRLPHSYLPDPFFRVYVSTIHKDKHGSDSGLYDTEGRFVPSRFEDIFAKYASTSSPTQPADTLSLSEVFRMIRGNRVAVDPFGWFAAVFEWGTSWLLLQKDGRVHKEDLRRMLEGSLFYEIRARRKGPKGWDKGWGLGGDGFIRGKKILPFSL
ncbi:hypothetical protein EW146_g7881 [Bondarzewia mesenterica]|uniref:EF-hand domain-containing protein n=1 Tax=Bondarzewia mesenterica TaxID=1095465 RepID=A0A4S4LIM2_9AGAM|nr:hypothetical protein EW146_g7881 [Bondarzewia mesenterica]